MPPKAAALRRMSLLLVFLISLCGLTVACQAQHHSAKADQSITLLATATAVESAATLPEDVAAEWASLAKASTAPGEATVRIVSSPAAPVERDITPVRGNGQIEHSEAARDKKIQQAIADLRRQLATMQADRPGLDLLRLFDAASTFPGSRIDVLSSGLSTESPLDFRQLGWTFDVDQVIDSVARQGLLPNLAGRHVTFYGLVLVAGTQPPLPPFARQLVTELWVRLCQRAGGVCGAVSDSGAASPPRATLPVPVVPIPSSVTIAGCPVWARLDDDDAALHFAADSPALGPQADAVLIPIVASASRCNLVVDVVGYIADVNGTGDSTYLSGRRAHAVADRLISLGLSPTHLGTVTGRGTADPIVPNLIDGRPNPGVAVNRRVELAFRHAS